MTDTVVTEHADADLTAGALLQQILAELKAIRAGQSEGLRRPQAARFVGVSVPHWDRMTAGGRNPAPVKVGKAVVWLRSELRSWMEAGCPRREEWEARRAAAR